MVEVPLSGSSDWPRAAPANAPLAVVWVYKIHHGSPCKPSLGSSGGPTRPLALFLGKEEADMMGTMGDIGMVTMEDQCHG